MIEERGLTSGIPGSEHPDLCEACGNCGGETPPPRRGESDLIIRMLADARAVRPYFSVFLFLWRCFFNMDFWGMLKFFM